MKLSILICLAVHWASDSLGVVFFLSCLFVIDTAIPSPLLPPDLYSAAGHTVVGFVGLNA